MTSKESIAEQIKADKNFLAQVGETLSNEQLQELSDEIERLEGQESVGEGEIFTPHEK